MNHNIKYTLKDSIYLTSYISCITRKIANTNVDIILLKVTLQLKNIQILF